MNAMSFMDTTRPQTFEPGMRVILMCRLGDRDLQAVPGVEWAKIAAEINQRSTNPESIEVTYKRYGETATTTWPLELLRKDRR